jgi:hypothetical protein
VIADPLTLARFLASAAGSLLGMTERSWSDPDVDALREQVAAALGLNASRQVPGEPLRLALWCLERAQRAALRAEVAR